ncbi:MAG: bifunctional 3-demethylubiquinol 3-O-methyltransferase/2-polyprenyl-6-hydroxyphenol methylase, partial [Devosiaceae bacterium]|nr:bifunctional 3-demethylubiquinol 3-O-methyltransferase/2-polyprenyl-6-hydroxyphenol methylase [Devosiaceae bacterium]
AYALAIIGAEYVLGWLPKGTHSFSKFLTPEEIISIISRHSMSIRDKSGVSFNPLHDQWRKSRDMSVNYMLLAEKS